MAISNVDLCYHGLNHDTYKMEKSDKTFLINAFDMKLVQRLKAIIKITRH